MSPKPLAEIAIDTSSLCLFQGNESLISSFVEKMNANPLRVTLSAYVLDEIMGGGKLQFVAQRAQAVGKIWNALSDQKFTLVRSIPEIMAEELTHDVHAVPTISSKKRKETRAFLTTVQPQTPTLGKANAACNELQAGKNKALELDSRVQDFLQEKGVSGSEQDKKDAIERMKNYAGPSQDILWVLESVLESKPNVSAEKIRKDPFLKSTRAFLSLTELLMMGAALAGTSKEEVIQTFAVEKNSWFDNMVTGSAAYASFYLVDDSGARKRANFLSDRGIIGCRAMTLKEFLALPNEDFASNQ